MAIVIPEGKQSYSNDAGIPLVGGRLYTYDAGTTTLKDTWSDAAQSALNTNPIILDARGEATVFWSGAYKVELRTAANAVIWTVDNVNSDDGASTGVSVLDFGAIGDGVTDDTAACQAAIAATCASGQGLYWPAGTYSVSGLTTPRGTAGRFLWYGDPNTIIKARAGTTAILTILGDDSRTGPRVIDTIKFDGDNILNISGVKGADSTALLYLHMTNCNVSRCYAAYDFGNVQESSWTNCFAESSVAGWLIESDSAGGGGTALTFNTCSTWLCDVGFFGKSNSPFPIGQWQFINPVIQGSRIAAVALSGAVGGNGLLDGVNFDSYYSEATGTGSVPGATVTIRGIVVPRGGLYASGANVVINGGQIGESIADCIAINMANASLVTIRDSNMGGGSKIQVTSDAASRINFEGRTSITGTGVNVSDWDGFYFNGSGGAWSGTPFIRPSQSPANKYAGAGSFPDAPEAGSAIVATPSKVLDPEFGLVQRVVYAASIGNTGTNRVIFDALSETTAIGDYVAISFLAKATTSTNLTFLASGATQLTGPQSVALTTQWRRVVIYGIVGAISAGGYGVFAYPPAADGPTVDFAKMMVSRVAVGSVPDAPNNIIKQGLYDNMNNGQTCIGQLTYDPLSIAAGAFGAEETVTIVGGVIGETCTAAFSLDSQGIVWLPRITSATQAKVIPWNATAAPIDLGSGTLRVFQ
jgi:hypothetical protein